VEELVSSRECPRPLEGGGQGEELLSARVGLHPPAEAPKSGLPPSRGRDQGIPPSRRLPSPQHTPPDSHRRLHAATFKGRDLGPTPGSPLKRIRRPTDQAIRQHRRLGLGRAGAYTAADRNPRSPPATPAPAGGDFEKQHRATERATQERRSHQSVAYDRSRGTSPVDIQLAIQSSSKNCSEQGVSRPGKGRLALMQTPGYTGEFQSGAKRRRNPACLKC
jgi:hypothetical protein